MFEARAEYLQAAIDEVKSNMVQLKRMLKKHLALRKSR